MALIINLVVGLIAFYFAYRFALNKQMVVTVSQCDNCIDTTEADTVDQVG